MHDFHLSRRRFTALAAGTTALSALPLGHSAFAQAPREVEIRGGQFRPVSIAVTDFLGDAQQGPALTQVMINNFRRSVYLAPVEQRSFTEKITNPDQAPQWDAWRTINAQYVVTGRTGRGPDGRMRTEFRLWDVTSGQQAAGQQFVTDPNNSRRVAHIISDAIFSRITGEKGFFDTRIVFVDETGPKERRRKRLAVMDQDGANVRYLTRGDDLALTPRFSPSSQDVAFMSFGNGDPKVTLLNVETSQREVVGNFPGMTFSPRFSPDGQKIIMSLTSGASTNIYAMDLRSRATTRLTDTSGIDTSPCYSPDGSQIAFESDRGGGQQIYVMGAGGGNARRISFSQGARYSTPVWSPKGDLIAFTRQRSGAFGIGVMRPDGSGERIITEGYHNEGPTFAPNGLFLMFFRDPGSGAKIYMADVTGRGEFPVPTPSFASDPSWGPLLS
ncbi:MULTISPECIES: Tol-Pal system beta propeller repeat protein TolB [unclassified Beijerinckia]|uniref:Tol-Pal system beta propeller repeat protein TolB n=1 Tax=unclassified Beijerinckia TaxID=2638183 RepID=UPI00089B6D7D|nr:MULTISPECIES: Tol-Pal system beta propeller repeat protein TolB [unclassified Beijerinckia]MDH7799369.1 TolB protein [Beijerinckia sp. GAS462]SED47892.1 TolB protein [Beijerinckia sp. 28-YEA-48]